ncbi:MAG: beta-lactamase family protein [Clostridiales bacterium]|nr:beta-lactamase family protein [Clostridiales bacterium]
MSMLPQDLLQNYIDNHEIAGAAVRVRKADEIVCEACLGYADISNRIPVGSDTIFRLASMTKPLTAIAAMTLVEQGKLSLSDPVSNYLPYFDTLLVSDQQIPTDFFQPGLYSTIEKKEKRQRAVDAVRFELPTGTLTIRMLLDHSSGLGEGSVSEAFLDRIKPGKTLEERVRIYSSVPLDFQPGTGTAYSPLMSFEIMGRIIERISGMDLNSYMKKHIFSPLGIKDIGFVFDEEQLSRITRLYEYISGGLVDVSDSALDWMGVNPLVNRYFSGAGGMLASLDAYERIVRLFAHLGTLDGVRILSEQSVREMKTVSAKHGLSPTPGLEWGLSLACFKGRKYGRSLGKNTCGWCGTWGTHFYFDTVNDVCVTLMINRSNIGGAHSYVARAVEDSVYENYSN